MSLGIYNFFNDLEIGKWDILNKDKWISKGAFFEILRFTETDEYNYMLLFSVEQLLIAKGYINLSPLTIYTEIDDSILDEVKLRNTEDYGSNYVGWY